MKRGYAMQYEKRAPGFSGAMNWPAPLPTAALESQHSQEQETLVKRGSLRKRQYSQVTDPLQKMGDPCDPITDPATDPL